MNMNITIGICLAIAFLTSGCASFTSNYPLKPNVSSNDMKSDRVIYYRDVQSLPKSTLSQPNRSDISVASLPADVIAAVIEQLFKTYPEVVEKYAEIRNSNATVQREFLAKGYDDPQALAAIEKIITQLKEVSKASILPSAK